MNIVFELFRGKYWLLFCLIILFTNCKKEEQESEEVIEALPPQYISENREYSVDYRSVNDGIGLSHLVDLDQVFFGNDLNAYFGTFYDGGKIAYFANTNTEIDVNSDRFWPVREGQVIDEKTRFSTNIHAYINKNPNEGDIAMDSVFYMGFNIVENKQNHFGWCKGKLEWGKDSYYGYYERYVFMGYCYENTGKQIIVGQTE